MPGLYNQSPGALYDPMALRQRDDIPYQMSPDAPAATPLNLGDEDWERPDYRRDPLKPVSGIPKPGLFTRLNYTPGGADALIALGAGLLSGNGFADGLARGATGFSNALEEGRQRNLPKTSFLADGAFIVQTDPKTGRTTLAKNPQVADYYEGLKQTEFQGKKSLAEIQGGLRSGIVDKQISSNESIHADDRAARSEDRAADREARITEAAANRDLRREIAASARGNRQVPPSAMKAYTEQTDIASQATQASQSLNGVMSMLKNGSLKLGALQNAKNAAALATGIGADEGTQNYAVYKQNLRDLQNAYLLANKGVQTDGDADRAMASLVSGNGDNASVLRNLEVVQRRLRLLADNANRNADAYDRQYGINGSPPASSQAPTSTGVKWRVVN